MVLETRPGRFFLGWPRRAEHVPMALAFSRYHLARVAGRLRHATQKEISSKPRAE
jgi:hypothetical protein